MKAAGTLFAFFAFSATALAQAPTYTRELRGKHLAATLQALRATDAQARENLASYTHLLAQNACRGESKSLRASCLIEGTRKNCQQLGAGRLRDSAAQSRCELVSDLLIVNQLSESLFIDNRTRYEIMNRSKDVRTAIVEELRRRYATLVTGYRLSRYFLSGSPSDLELGWAIDAYCMEQADQHGLSWQHCVAAVVWFIGTTS